MTQEDIKKIKEVAEEFFAKMTVVAEKIEVSEISKKAPEEKEVVNLSVKLEDPQIIIGQKGQTLFEIQKLLKIVLNKKLQNNFYLNIDINDYKKNKADYLRSFAREVADEVALTKKEKILSFMPAYERRIIHDELSGRTDIVTESHGEGQNRHIAVKPR